MTKFGVIDIDPFYVEKIDDSFINSGVASFLEESAEEAYLLVERVFENEKHGIVCLLKERELTLKLSTACHNQ